MAEQMATPAETSFSFNGASAIAVTASVTYYKQ